MHDGGDWRGVARTPFAARAPDHPARQLMEGCHGRTFRSADVDDQQVTVDQGSGCGAEEILRDRELGSDIAFPAQLPGLQVQAMQLALRTVGVHTVSVDHRAGARTVIVAVPVLKLRWIT